MSKQSSQFPVDNDKTKAAPAKKDKPWVLWHKSTWFSKESKWSRWGKYRSKEEAEYVYTNCIRNKSYLPGFWQITHGKEKPE